MKLRNQVCLFAFMVSLLLCSCDKGKGNVEQFVMDFCDALVAEDKSAIEKAYPDSKNFDIESFNFDKAKVAVENLDGKDGVHVTLAKGRELFVEKQSDGTFLVKDSRGLLSVPSEKKELAQLSGWIDPSLTDTENALRLNDAGFEHYLKGLLNNLLKKKLKVVEVEYEEVSNVETEWFDEEKTEPMIWDYSDKVIVKIANNLNVDIDASAYNCKAVVFVWDYWAPMPKKPIDVASQAIKAHDMANLIFFFDGSYECVEGTGEIEHIESNVTFNLENIDLSSVYEFSGNEYADYLSNGDVKIEEDAPLCVFEGTIGGNEGCYLAIDGQKGSYNIMRDVRTLSLDKYDSETGELSLNAYIDKSLIGQFKGKLTGKEGKRKYKGVFTNKKNGAKIDFDLKE